MKKKQSERNKRIYLQLTLKPVETIGDQNGK